MTFSYSVFVPAYNAESTIGATLRSLLTQKLSAEQVVVIDDGSTDDTVGRCQSAGVECISTTHVGLAGVRNIALDMATAPWFAMLDADDTWSPTMATAHAEASRNLSAEVAAVTAQLQPFGAAATAWKRRVATRSAGGVQVVAPEQLWDHNPLTASATFLRVAAVRSVGGWDASLGCAEDYDMALRLWAGGHELASIEEVHGHYLVRSDSLTAKVATCLYAERDVFRAFFATQRRTAQLPGVSLDNRLRKAWLRGAARAANYGQALTQLPPLQEFVGRGPTERVLDTAVRNRFTGRLAASMWRGVAALRG